MATTKCRTLWGEKQQLTRRKAHPFSCHETKDIFFLQKSMLLFLKLWVIRLTGNGS